METQNVLGDMLMQTRRRIKKLHKNSQSPSVDVATGSRCEETHARTHTHGLKSDKFCNK